MSARMWASAIVVGIALGLGIAYLIVWLDSRS